MSDDEIDRRTAALQTNWREEDWAAADAVMLDYAEQLTVAPQAVTSEHAERMRGAGWDDRAIHDICSIVAYFAFVNRIADGLGVELESDAGGQPDQVDV